LVPKQAFGDAPPANFTGIGDRFGLPYAIADQGEILSLNREHRIGGKRTLRVLPVGLCCRDQPVRYLFPRHLSADAIEIRSSHCVLQGRRFELAAVNDRLAFGCMGGGKTESFLGDLPFVSWAYWAALPCLTSNQPSVDTVLDGSLFPFSFERVLVVIGFGLTGLQSYELCSFGTTDTLLSHRLFDILAPLRKRHHLFAGVAFKLPGTISSGRKLDAIAEVLDLSRELGAIERGAVLLRSVNLDRVEPAPFSIRPLSYIEQHDMGVQLWIRSPVCIQRGTGGEMSEPGAHDIRADDSFAVTPIMGHSVLLNFRKTALDRP
jgi:hypothetical protein